MFLRINANYLGFALAGVLTLGSMPAQASYLRLDRTNRANKLGNPIYALSGYAHGRRMLRVDAVSGTATTQHRDRHRGNNYAPLPDGSYRVGAVQPSYNPRIGRTFIPIFPRFRTHRTALGIHLNPSFNKHNGRDGTAGCIGIAHRQDRDRLNRFTNQYHPHKLLVRIHR